MTEVTVEYTTADGTDRELTHRMPDTHAAPYWDDVRRALALVPDDAIATGVSVNGTTVTIP